MKHIKRKKVMNDPNTGQPYVYTEDSYQYGEGDEEKEKVLRAGNELAELMPKHAFGHKKLGWMFVKASSVERQKTLDVEGSSIARFEPACTFEAALGMLKILESKVYEAFGRNPPAVRTDIKDTNA